MSFGGPGGRIKIIDFIEYPENRAGIFPQRTPARVNMDIAGRVRSVDVGRPLGDANNPMDQSAVEAKLHDLGRDLLSAAEMAALIQAVARLKGGEIAPLLACLEATLPGGS